VGFGCKERLEYLLRLLRRKPYSGITHGHKKLLHLAILALEDSRLEQARQLLEKVLQLNPQSSMALRQLGQLESQAGEYVTPAKHLGSRARDEP
jgi:Tfp pilus assembly protein PilF